MTKLKWMAVLLTALAMTVMGASSASAVLAGHKVTVTNIDPDTNTVDIYVTGYMDNTYPYTTLWVGFNTAGGGTASAVNWGDSASTVVPYGNGPSTGIPRVATSTVIDGFNVHVYRGAFSHTYAAPGDYTITSNSVPRAITHTPITGNYATSTGGSSLVFLTNTTVASVGTGGPEIPTASETGLLTLALALVAAGVFVLRRS